MDTLPAEVLAMITQRLDALSVYFYCLALGYAVTPMRPHAAIALAWRNSQESLALRILGSNSELNNYILDSKIKNWFRTYAGDILLSKNPQLISKYEKHGYVETDLQLAVELGDAEVLRAHADLITKHTIHAIVRYDQIELFREFYKSRENVIPYICKYGAKRIAAMHLPRKRDKLMIYVFQYVRSANMAMHLLDLIPETDRAPMSGPCFWYDETEEELVRFNSVALADKILELYPECIEYERMNRFFKSTEMLHWAVTRMHWQCNEKQIYHYGFQHMRQVIGYFADTNTLDAVRLARICVRNLGVTTTPNTLDVLLDTCGTWWIQEIQPVLLDMMQTTRNIQNGIVAVMRWFMPHTDMAALVEQITNTRTCLTMRTLLHMIRLGQIRDDGTMIASNQKK